MASRAELQAAIAAAESEVQGLQRCLVTARQAARRASRNPCQRFSQTKRSLAALAVKIGGDQSYGVKALRLELSRGSAPTGRWGEEDLAQAVQDLCAHAPTQAAAAEMLAAGGNSTLVYRAAKLVAEADVAQWVLEMNAKGVAPSRGQLLAALRRSWRAPVKQTRALRLLLRLRRRCKSAHKWATRFRKRWGLAWRSLSAHSELTQGELRDRARGSGLKSFSAPHFGPKCGAIF